MDKERFIWGIDHWTYSRRSHWYRFEELDIELYGSKVDLDEVDLKVYQDLLITMIIKRFIPSGSRILEVGGGISRVLACFSEKYECWNIDMFEGLGNGPDKLHELPYTVIQDYMGNFNQALPDNYFDFVFSISALEHVEDSSRFVPICNDIDRVLKPGGLSAHLLDIIFLPDGGMWSNGIMYTMFDKPTTINSVIAAEEMSNNPDLYYLSKSAYENFWRQYTGIDFEEHGRASSMNIFWLK